MNMNSTWEPFNSYHSTHQTPCKLEDCLDQAEVSRPADDTCVALSLQTTWLNKTVRGPMLQSLVLMGQGHQWPRQVGWQGVVWDTPPVCPPHCQGLVAGSGCWRQEVSLPGLPLWSMQGREVLLRAASRFSGRTLLQATRFSLWMSLHSSHCQPTVPPTLIAQLMELLWLWAH